MRRVSPRSCLTKNPRKVQSLAKPNQPTKDKNKMTITTNKQIATLIQSEKPRSAWSKAVQTYALEMLEELESDYTAANLLNGAENWEAYSYGGSSLIYDTDIAERLCSPSELKKTRNGERQPNAKETWLDCQARALSQAARLIARKARVATLPSSSEIIMAFVRESLGNAKNMAELMEQKQIAETISQMEVEA